MIHQIYKVFEDGRKIFLAIATPEGNWLINNQQRSAMADSPALLGENLAKVTKGIDAHFPNLRRLLRMESQIMSIQFPLTDEEICEFSKAYDEKRSEKESDKFLEEHPGI